MGERGFKPMFDARAQLVETACEKVIGGFDQDKLFWFGSGRDEGLEFFARAEGIAGAADE
jgi:hypothetical protein